MRKILTLLLIVLPALTFAQVKYEKSIEIDGQIGLKESEGVHYRFGVEMINGLRVSPLFSFGLGIGLQTGEYDYKKSKGLHDTDYVISKENTTFLPVFLRAKLNLSKKQISPFIAFNIGYLSDIGDTSLVKASCLLAEGDIGVDIPIKENSKIYLMLGYTTHETEMYVSSWLSSGLHEGVAPRNTKMICIRAGFAF